MSKGRLLLVIVGIFLVLAGFFAYSKLTGYTDLTINNINADEVKIYTASVQNTGQLDITYNTSSSPTAEIFNKGSHTIRLKGKKSYVVVGSSKQPYYETSTSRINLAEEPVKTTVELKLSDAYLKQLLAKEQPLALAALQSKYPAQFNSYTATGGKLYKEGQWYAVKLVPKAGGDTYRVVLKKQNGNWTVVTDPPAIILSAPVYPSVPREILSDINNF